MGLAVLDAFGGWAIKRTVLSPSHAVPLPPRRAPSGQAAGPLSAATGRRHRRRGAAAAERRHHAGGEQRG